ncbi:MAG: response regulator transcription factor [Dehalococcoidia bacterium]
MSRTAVLLDQHPLWLDAVEEVVARLGFRVAGKATTPEAALKLVEQQRPDLFVSEIETGGNGRGIACLRAAHERVSGLKIVVLSSHADSEHVEQGLAAGAAAYVVKTSHPDDLAVAIRQAFSHSIYFAAAQVPAPARDGEAAAEAAELTRRELEILRLVAEGFSNAELARRLWVTEQTVKFHLSNIYRKLNVSNRTEASRWAQVHGLLPARAAEMSAA